MFYGYGQHQTHGNQNGGGNLNYLGVNQIVVRTVIVGKMAAVDLIVAHYSFVGGDYCCYCHCYCCFGLNVMVGHYAVGYVVVFVTG